jgi:NAD-dependent deacetylase
MCSRTFFDGYTAEFYDFYTDRMLFLDAQPNRAHRKLAELEEQGILGAVVTQNIDGLHQAAGSKNVFELHGGVLRNFCRKCNRFYDVHQMMGQRDLAGDGVPRCECGGVIKPDVVLYEEPLDEAVMEGAIRAIASADLLLIAGTSLAVYPAAGLIDFFHGSHLAIVNMSPTDRDKSADICIAASIGEVLDF